MGCVAVYVVHWRGSGGVWLSGCPVGAAVAVAGVCWWCTSCSVCGLGWCVLWGLSGGIYVGS